jgi:hypothetical protein
VRRRLEETPLLRLNRILCALALACGLSNVASAVMIDFSLATQRETVMVDVGGGVMEPRDQLTLTVSLDQPVDIIGYEFWIQYDADELEWNDFTELSGLGSSTPLPGAPNHEPGGLKAVGLSFSLVSTSSPSASSS